VRYVDDRVATIWLQADAACEVEVRGVSERTWCVGGLHFALVAIDGLAVGEDHPYEVRLDGEPAWPEPGSAFPASTIRLLDTRRRRDIVFGSCRTTRPHEPPYVLRASEHQAGQGIDALRAYALRLACGGAACPDMLLMLGDQIYADQPSPALQEVLAARQRPADVPRDELADFSEYALAYREAWSEPAIRWLFSTVPVTMIFDDHEIHAEWRISQGWLDEMNAEPWFDRHIRAGLMAYWVFQHIGNLSPGRLADGGLYDAVRAAGDAAELLASRMDTEGRQVGHSRWSFVRELGDARLVVIDSRAGRQVTPGQRELIQDEEWDWIREQAGRPARHLLLASSVPFLLAPGLHHVEAFDEALTDGAWGRLGAALGEKLRRLAVLDHWASFQRTFHKLAELIDDVAHGRAGDAPASIVMLSGDVHHCYLAEVGFRHRTGLRSSVWQAACSAFRKELAPLEKRTIAFGHSVLAERLARRLARGAGVAPLPLDWRVVERPAFANQIATLTLDGEHATLAVEAIADGDWRHPQLEIAFTHDLS
jgi:phosphodiesterase/alkaline phosphatase D-like protein